MPTLAFPGAKGFGAYSLGGRGGTGPPKCYLINTLADNNDAPELVSGTTYTSSFRAAMRSTGPRFIVPMIGGTCTATIVGPGTSAAGFEVTDSYFTILGGMAPGGGFCFQGELRLRCDHKIITHMRFRGGSDFVFDTNDSLGLRGKLPSGNTEIGGIVDHCDISWGFDNNCSVGSNYHSVTHCILGPEFGRGMLIGSQANTSTSLIGNIQYHNIVRQPRIDRGRLEYINNVIAARRSEDKMMMFAWFEPLFLNIQGNSTFLLSGETPGSNIPPTSPDWDFARPYDEFTEAFIVNGGGPASGSTAASKVHFDDNHDEYWRSTGAEAQDANVHTNGTGPGLPRTGPNDFTTDPNFVSSTTLPWATAHAAALHPTTGAGAWQCRDANGNFVSIRDARSSEIIDNFGFSPVRGLNYPDPDNVFSIAQAGGLPSLASGLPLGSAFTSTGDRGGIPDTVPIPAGEKWSTITANGRNHLENYAYQESPGPQVGITYFVTPTGSNSNSGLDNGANAWRWASDALTKMSGGDNVIVSAGVYGDWFDTNDTGNFPLGFNSGTSWENAITIEAAEGATVTMRPPSGSVRPFIVNFNDLDPNQYIIFKNIIFDGVNITSDCVAIKNGTHHIRFENCTIKDAPLGRGVFMAPVAAGYPFALNVQILGGRITDNGSATTHHGVHVSGSNVLIRDAEIDNNSGYGVAVFNAQGEQLDDCTISHNNIHHNSQNAGTQAGLILSNGSDHQAINNVIHHNGDGIEVGSFGSTLDALLYNNTLADNDPGYGVRINASSTGAIVKNNIIDTNAAGGILNNGASSTITPNLIDDAGVAFVNRAGEDYHILTGSTAKDVGETIALVIDDKDGVARPVGAGYDHGAYEFTGGGGALPVNVFPLGEQLTEGLQHFIAGLNVLNPDDLTAVRLRLSNQAKFTSINTSGGGSVG